MGNCYSADHIAEDHIHTNITCNIEEPQKNKSKSDQKYRFRRFMEFLQNWSITIHIIITKVNKLQLVSNSLTFLMLCPNKERHYQLSTRIANNLNFRGSLTKRLVLIKTNVYTTCKMNDIDGNDLICEQFANASEIVG